MSRYRTKWNQEVYNKMLKEGYGQGTGVDYKPWISIYDFSSQGRVARIKGKKIDRIFHLLSSIESSMFYILQWDDSVKDIREQYPLLSVNETIDISENLGIKHPVDNKTGVAYVVTTDFLVTRLIEGKEIMLAYAIKPIGELSKQRVIDKLKIEETFWAKRSIKWQLVTDMDINRTMVSNIKWFFEAYDIERLINPKNVNQMTEILYSFIQENTDKSAIRSVIELDEVYDVEQGNFLTLLKHLLAHKFLIYDLSKPFSNSIKLSEIQINKEKFKC